MIQRKFVEGKGLRIGLFPSDDSESSLPLEVCAFIFKLCRERYLASVVEGKVCAHGLIWCVLFLIGLVF